MEESITLDELICLKNEGYGLASVIVILQERARARSNQQHWFPHTGNNECIFYKKPYDVLKTKMATIMLCEGHKNQTQYPENDCANKCLNCGQSIYTHTERVD